MKNGIVTKRQLLIASVIGLPPLFVMCSSWEHARIVALFLSIVILWFTELLPLPITGILVPVLGVLYGLFNPKDAFLAFGNDILFLFIGCFFVAQAMQKHRWDKRMAYSILSGPAGDLSPNGLVATLAIIAWVLSMWVSNTATCAILTPVALGIVASYAGQSISEASIRNLTTQLLLATAFASTMGGLATPVGTPPNLLALDFLKQNGQDISFFSWMILAAPISLAMLLALLTVLRVFFPIPPFPTTTSVRTEFRSHLHALGPIKREELQVAAVFLIMVALWILPGLLESIFPESRLLAAIFSPFSLSMVGISSALLLFWLEGPSGPNLSWSDAQEIDWGTILLFGGGLSLGSLLTSSGLAKEIGVHLFAPDLSPFVLICLVVGLSILISEFASNTASAAIIIPILLSALHSADTTPVFI
ncbi:MAG: DASS family sodium-coupled anion symporter, partial [Bdellovibrionales bacterium]|nr:DASS family sodium-coupled anion symporter [Bdellovibrionales bacterium]